MKIPADPPRSIPDPRPRQSVWPWVTAISIALGMAIAEAVVAAGGRLLDALLPTGSPF